MSSRDSRSGLNTGRNEAGFHYYEPGAGTHGLPHDPLKSCVAPRPIGWISSRSSDGRDNLAPYSFFNLMSDSPPVLAIGSSGHKDSLENIEQTGAFIANIVSGDLRDVMNVSSAPYPPGTDEFDAAGLEKVPGSKVACARVAASPVHLECRLLQVIDLPHDGSRRNAMILGQIVAIHIAERVLTDGLVDTAKLDPLARLGYREYGRVAADVFELNRPGQTDRTQA